MPEIYGSHFKYGSTSSFDYDLIFASVESARDARCAGTIAGTTIFNRHSQKRYLIGNDYKDFPLTLDIDIVTDDDEILTDAQRRNVEKWLFNKSKYQKLYLLPEPDTDITGDFYLNCRFVNPEKLEYNGGVVGYHVTLEADTGMWCKDISVQQSYNGHSPTIFTVTVDTDVDEYIYPKVTLSGLNSVNVDGIGITNESDIANRATRFAGISGTMVINGDIRSITSPQENFAKFTERHFPRLLSGENIIKVTGVFNKITITYTIRRMM